MSKLAHSNQQTMDEIDLRHAIETGNEDLIPMQKREGWHPDHPAVRMVHSASSLDTLQACPWRFQLKYVEGWRSRTKSQYADAAKFGHIIHAALTPHS